MYFHSSCRVSGYIFCRPYPPPFLSQLSLIFIFFDDLPLIYTCLTGVDRGVDKRESLYFYLYYRCQIGYSTPKITEVQQGWGNINFRYFPFPTSFQKLYFPFILFKKNSVYRQCPELASEDEVRETREDRPLGRGKPLGLRARATRLPMDLNSFYH